MRKNTYEVDGLIFHSIKELSKHSGVHEKTITARMRRGMSPQEACQNTDLRCSYYEDGETQKSISQICREKQKDKDLIHNRLKYGYSMDKALNTPKKITRQGIPVVVNGVLYNSIAAAVKQLGLEHKESTIRRRIKEGMDINAAFNNWG